MNASTQSKPNRVQPHLISTWNAEAEADSVQPHAIQGKVVTVKLPPDGQAQQLRQCGQAPNVNNTHYSSSITSSFTAITSWSEQHPSSLCSSVSLGFIVVS